MAEVLLLARAADLAVARRIETNLQAMGAATRIDTQALAQGRLPPALEEPLRKADAVVLLLTAADPSEPWWRDDLVDAVRGVGGARLVPVLLGEHPTRNMIWPIVADFSAISVPDPGALGALLRFLQPMLEPPLSPPTVAQPSVVAPMAFPEQVPAAPGARDTLLAKALLRQQAALGFLAPGTPVVAPPRRSIDDPAQLDRWGPESRHALALLECLRGLEFDVDYASGARTRIDIRYGGRSVALVELGAPTDAMLVAQVERVRALAAAREERAAEIVVQAGQRWPFWEQVAVLAPERRPRTRELLDAAVAFADLVKARLKHAFAVPRPIEWSALVMPLLTSAPDGSYPMGTAIEAYLVARVLESLADERGDATQAFRRVAHRMSENRVVAGLNFPVDAVAGRAVGVALGNLLVARCTEAPAATVRLDGETLAAGTDFLFAGDPVATSPMPPGYLPRSPMLEHLWARARIEWQR